MDLRIEKQSLTLVDQVESKLLEYLKANDFQPGASLPAEQELAKSLGVARGVLREALSRLRMLGMIETRTQRGMIFRSPSLLTGMGKVADPQFLNDDSLFETIGFRITLELGIVNEVFDRITPADVAELERIVQRGGILEHNEYPLASEYSFHSKLYAITQNAMIIQFQSMIRPLIHHVKEKFEANFKPINIELKAKGLIVTHADLLDFIKKNDKEGFRTALEKHFLVYKIFLKQRE